MNTEKFLLNDDIRFFIQDIVNCQTNMMPKTSVKGREFLKRHYQSVYPYIVRKKRKKFKK